MKYTISKEIALPRERVLELLADPANRPKWLRDLVSHEPIQGVDGQVGTRSKIVFRSGQKTIELTETITRREPPDLSDVSPDQCVYFEREIFADGLWNAAREYLTASSAERTLWVSENEYRFKGLMRLAAPFLRAAFIKQSSQVMQDFKEFAERGRDVREATV